MKPIQNILVVGGDTTGRLTAALFACTLGTAGGGVQVTFGESGEAPALAAAGHA